MEEFYRLNSVLSCSDEIVRVDNIVDATATTSAGFLCPMDNMLQVAETGVTESEMTDLIKTQISNHPFYPNLVSAYIECQKVTPFFIG